MMQLHHEYVPSHQNRDPVSAGWAWLALIAAAAALAFLAAACSSNSGMSCRGDNDCPGQACINGICRPIVGGQPDLSMIAPGSDGGDVDMAKSPLPPMDGGLGLDALAASCTFNSDGVIQRSEAPFLVGLGALYAVNASGTTVPVSESGSSWDFSSAVSNESKVFDQILSASGQWWSNDFPTATYAEILEDGQTTLGVYRASNDKLELLGLVSEQSGFQQTELTYSTPISILKFPISVGDHFTSESDITGTYQGIAFVGHDGYDVTVDKRGTTKVPAGSFDTLRIRLNYTQMVGFVTTTRITYLHLAECYGAVARVRSQDNESSNDFTQAAEYRRLATQ
jgi:hypothetical protein